MINKLTAVPNYVVASSPRGLRRLMFLNNKKHGAYIKYRDIRQGKDGKWYAWFDVEDEESLVKDVAENKEQLDG